MITIELPWPDKALNPNSRVHHHEKAQVKALARHAAKNITLDELPRTDLIPLWTSEHYQAMYIFHPPNKRHRDIDNCFAMCKPYQDGICDAIHINDKTIKRTVLEWGDVCKPGKVVVRLEELNDV